MKLMNVLKKEDGKETKNDFKLFNNKDLVDRIRKEKETTNKDKSRGAGGR